MRFIILLTMMLTLLSAYSFPANSQSPALQADPNVNIVKAHCTACHSAALITQNRLTREGWLNTIRWMQEKQNLWPLGEHEAVILDYLEKYYYPADTGRRKPLAPHLMPQG